MSATNSPGVVYLVGAGPGDPGLITVRGRELLEKADAIVYDALANPLLLDRARTAGRAELIDAGKRGGSTESAKQDDINAVLISLARAGKQVVRLKGGDPFVFGRGSEEAQALHAAGIPFEIVPGVTAGIAAPAYAGIPVTHRGVATSVTFVTGHEDPSKPTTTVDWNALAKCASTGTVVLYMGVKTLPSIARALVDGGLSPTTPAAAVQWGTHSRQRTVVATIQSLAGRAAEEGITAPVITIIGESVNLRHEIAWFESRPLFGRRIVVTRATAVGGGLAEQLRALGADVLDAPATTIQPLDRAATDEAIANLADYQWLVLTSPTGVRFFFDALDRAGLDSRALANLEIAVIGPATAAALEARGLKADVIPPKFVAESLLETLAGLEVAGTRVLYATADDARDVLAAGLKKAGALVDVVAMYRSVPLLDDARVDEIRGAVAEQHIDLVCVTSASGVSGFVAQVGAERARGVRCASIGPVTSDAARAVGMEVVAEPAQASISDLVRAVIAWAQQSQVRA